MPGFFTDQEVEEMTTPISEQGVLASTDPNCSKCKLYLKCKNPKLDYSGEGRTKTLIIAEANGPTEDEVGTQLIGEVGQDFRSDLKYQQMELDRDFWKHNAVNCWPHTTDGTRTPTADEITCCRPLVKSTIERLHPHIIWVLGGTSAKSMFGDRFKECDISRWRGLMIPDKRTNAWIFPMYHPSFKYRDKDNENLKAIYYQDMRHAISCIPALNTQRPVFGEYENEVEPLYDINQIIFELDHVIQTQPAWFWHDYETSGLKPHRPGHKIATISFSTDPNKAYSFPYEYKDFFGASERAEIKRRMRIILTNPYIHKGAHNIKFENIWSKYRFGVDIHPMTWCTMVGAHCIDTRKRYTGLKFQSYINFGVDPYDGSVAKFLIAHKGEFNRIDQAPLKDLLQYGGMDSLMSHKLRLTQKRFFNDNPKVGAGFEFFMDGIRELAHIEQHGWNTIPNFYTDKEKEVTNKITTITSELINSDEVNLFREQIGRLPDLGSNGDLQLLFYTVLEQKAVLTPKGGKSLSQDTLTKFNLPFANKLLERSNLTTIKNSFLNQYKREICNDKMFPVIDLHIPRSLRGSCSKPNLQNVPVRNAIAKEACRGGLIPSQGNQLLESDFKSIEVCIAAIETGDRNLIKYVSDPATDMHRDSAMDVWRLKQSSVTKLIRFYSKNRWVFPQFYGSYYGTCAEDLWEIRHILTIEGISLRQHLRTVGINDLEDFKEHLKKVERVFWYDRFPEYTEWKKRANVEYRKKGYIELKFGFRRGGYCHERQVNNTPIQGTAFHCLLWTLIRVNRIARKEKWESKLIMQVHDNTIFDAVPSETAHIIETINRVGTQEIREHFDWITVPLAIEHEISPIDGSWHELEEMKEAA